MHIITYSLNNGEKSANYYKTVADFADEVLLQSESLTRSIVDSFGEFIIKTGREEIRSAEEYTLEFLTMGVLYKIYSDDALDLSEAQRCLLTNLSAMRQHYKNLKPGIDFLRGVLGTVFLSPNDRKDLVFPEPTLDNLNKLIGWLRAAGEFKQEAKRLDAWVDFLNGQPESVACNVIATSITFALWFEVKSEEMLGSYTQNVVRYLSNFSDNHRWREDFIFCRRRRVEYHLNMVGAEIMNRAFRVEFLNTDVKMVLLPSCMRANKDDKCRAVSENDGYRCTGCTSSCRVNNLKTLGEKYKFGVKIIPHESSAFSKETLSHGRIGIIGIACVLNLLSGGWKARDLGLVPQCVLLDYCGCSNHWDEEGFSTDINMVQLRKILNIV